MLPETLKHIKYIIMKNTKEMFPNVTRVLKVQSCRLYSNKFMIASTQITKTEIFAFIAVLVFKLMSRKVLFINRKDNRNC